MLIKNNNNPKNPVWKRRFAIVPVQISDSESVWLEWYESKKVGHQPGHTISYRTRRTGDSSNEGFLVTYCDDSW